MGFSRKLYQFAVWLFVVGVLVQTFFAGTAVVARLTGWENHIALGHMLGLPVITMLISMYTGRLPQSFRRLTWLLFVVYFIQADVVIFLRVDLPLASALHPVLALLDFTLGWNLAQRMNNLPSESQSTA